MSDRVDANTQVQQKTLSGSLPKSSLLQRTCACGQHTLAGGECQECRKKREGGLHRSQRAFGPPSGPGAVAGTSPAQENGTSFNSAFDRASRFGHDFSWIPVHSSHSLVLQTKLTINQPGDVYEQEADRIAYQVMATSADPAVSGAPPHIQRFAGQSTGTADAAPVSVDQVLASPGRPLEPTLQQDMEQRFGYDFSRVRVHSDAAAEQSARDVNAHAYTVGHDIVFDAGRYAPGTHEGRRLLAHELTHVVQQSNRSGEDPITIGLSDDSYEQEADTISIATIQRGNKDTTNNTETNITRTANGSLIQRKPNTKGTQARFTEIEQRQQVQMELFKKFRAAMLLDQEWRARFGERIASYRQSILRITRGLDAATEGFKNAQMAQAKTDALKTQLLETLLTAGFGWVFGPDLGILGEKLGEAKEIIGEISKDVMTEAAKGVIEKFVEKEKAEVSVGVYITGEMTSSGAGMSGGAIAYLTRNLEALDHHTQLIEQAFVDRSKQLQALSDEQWEWFDLAAQEVTYKELLDDLNDNALGIESMKPESEVEQVLERHMWALWLVPEIVEGNFVNVNFGSDIEERLNQIGVSKQAGVTLTEHWYSRNSPESEPNWIFLLYKWAKSYKEPLHM